METAPEVKATRTQLSRIESYKVIQWMEGRKALTTSLTAEVLSKKLTEELGFFVSYHQATCIRAELGLGPRKDEAGPRAKNKDYKSALRILAREVIDLRKKLNEPVSTELELLANI